MKATDCLNPTGHAGARPACRSTAVQPLIETIWQRRTHRVSQGSSVLAGSMSYQSKLRASRCRSSRRRC